MPRDFHLVERDDDADLDAGEEKSAEPVFAVVLHSARNSFHSTAITTADALLHPRTVACPAARRSKRSTRS